ncbi:hypothetical protein [Bacteroides sp. 51]|uniref:hypothetical protein n=1 Tax=Bacteroides sp. 51 TaxID=2302938 RepID=UPI0013D020A6|nr:hypothetical protein [Bacteroides sp. 51]NDV80576.1 hypothetical protein [Bacteroides sp. 51]
MSVVKKITVGGVLQEGFSIGLKNAVSLLGAVLLWAITFWIPYLNVGTTIAMATIPAELSKGKVISPTFIFDAKYRKYMGEFFNLLGLMFMSIFPALLFVIIPAYVIALGWCLAIFIMFDKGISPSEALIRSNHATYGYKWTIFFVIFILGIANYILTLIFALIPFLGPLLVIALMLIYNAVMLGCFAVIYRDLTKEEADVTPAELPAPPPPVIPEPTVEAPTIE